MHPTLTLPRKTWSSRRLGLMTLAFAAATACASCTDGARNNVHPDDAAKKWATDLKIPIHGVSCTMFDSDGDGYVSCVVSIDRGTDFAPIYQGLQCGEFGSTKAGGCKPDSKNPKVDIVEWRVSAPQCPPQPACPECPKCPPSPARPADSARLGF